jgi:transketolase
VDVATGSLGQGLNAGVGMAYSMKNFEKRDNKVFVLIGDAEMQEGSNWEAMNFASYYKLDNVIAMVDCNRLGQSAATSLEHHFEVYGARFESFGFHTQIVDGHDIDAIAAALKAAHETEGKPSAIIFKTFKGKGCGESIEDHQPWHGKPIKDPEVLASVEARIKNPDAALTPRAPAEEAKDPEPFTHPAPTLNYTLGDKIATRATFGEALLRLGNENPRVIGLDADVKNSTMAIKLFEAHPEQFVNCFVAEQNLVGVSLGVGARGYIPFCATFGTFFTRAADHIRMAAVSFANIKFVGTHVGVSIGADGPSQMGLEDIAMFRAIPNCTVLYPSDAVSMEWAMNLAANNKGMFYLRANRPATPIVYENTETFEIGQSKIVKQADTDKVTVVAAGATFGEAIAAHETLAAEGITFTLVDLFCVKPVDKATILAAAQKTGGTVLVVEEHYPEGGCAEAVRSALALEDVKVHSLNVMEIPRSGEPQELLEKFGIDRNAIVKKVKELSA